MKKTDFIGGLAKGLKVIEAFDQSGPRLSIAEISRLTGFDRAATRRCLLTLSQLGYASHDGKFFTLTPRILRLGHSYLSSACLPGVIQPFLDRLSEKIGHSTSSSILDGTEIVYIARASLKRVISINLTAGSRLPAWCSSMGRVLLGSLACEDLRQRLQQSDITPRTAKTLATRQALEEELKTVTRQGYAFVDEELEMGLCSLAVPLKDRHGRTIAALNIGMPAAQIKREDIFNSYLPQLQTISADISRLLTCAARAV